MTTGLVRPLQSNDAAVVDEEGFIVGIKPASDRENRLAAFSKAGSEYALMDPSGGVVALSEVMPEVLATATATSTQVSGAGTYGWYRCTTATGNITVYDSLSASGKVLVPTTALAVGVFPIGGAGNPTRLAVGTGVTTVLSGAGVVYIGCETS